MASDEYFDINEKDKLGRTPLYIAAMYGDYTVCNVLLRRGAQTGVANFCGETPLHKAVEWSHFDIVRMLVDYGADVNAENMQGETPLFLCTRYPRSISKRIQAYLKDQGGVSLPKYV